MKSLLRLLTLSVVGYAAFALPSESRAQLLITGNDEKVSFDENTGAVSSLPSRLPDGPASNELLIHHREG